MNVSKHYLLNDIRIILLLVLVCLLAVGCSRTKTGTLVGVEASFALDEALKGKIGQIEFGGTVIVELGDGTKVKAVCDKALWSKLRGGQKLKITPIDSDTWQVIGIVENNE